MKNKFSWISGDKPSTLLRFVSYFTSVIIIFVLAFFIYGQYFTSHNNLLTGVVSDFNKNWFYDDGNGNIQIISLPSRIDCDTQDEVTIYKPLPSIVDGTKYICILNRWDMDVYINDTLRYTSRSDPGEIPGGYVKSHYILIPVNNSDSCKKIKIVRPVGELESIDFNSIIFGDKTGIYYKLISEYGVQMIFSIILLVISVMILITSYILLLVYRRSMPIIHLANGMVLAALWFIFDSFLYQILFNNYYVDGPMEYILIMISPLFFIRYINCEQQHHYEKAYSVASLFILANTVIMAFLHFKGIRSFEKNLPFTSLNAIIAILLFTITILIDLIKGRIKDYYLVAIGFGMIIVFGIIQAFVLNFSVDNHNALFLITGMYLLLSFAVVHIISQLREIEDQSRRQKHANELKSNFLANMSHEIRTPVNAILGMNEMIFRESSENEVKQYSTNIKNAGIMLLDIINDILDFSKIESGKMELICESYKLSDMLLNLYNIVSIRAIDKDLQFSVSIDPDIPSSYYGDDNRIQQILINILNNAIKYTKQGSVVFSVSINKELSGELNNPEIAFLHFEVTDTGIGIKDEDMDKLFATFERIDLKNNRSIEGTGLGLSITNSLVELMDGKLNVKSVYGHGSTFSVDIPQKVTSNEPIGKFEDIIEAKKTIIPIEKHFTAPDVKILIVDDVKMNILVIKGLLKAHKVQVFEAFSGAECLDMYEDGKYDLILLDHMMPEMDGIETLGKLKEQHPHLCPVIMLTANAISGMKEMYIEKGFDDYLSKPTKPSDLNAMIQKYVYTDKIHYVE